jgi:hypothetical protein
MINTAEIEMMASLLREFDNELSLLKKYAAVSERGIYLYYKGHSAGYASDELQEPMRRHLFELQRDRVRAVMDKLHDAGVDTSKLRDQLGVVNIEYRTAEKENQS